MFKRAIVGFFRVLRKAATGELSHFQMIGNTLATDPFSGTGLIGTVTFFKVLLPITFHVSLPLHNGQTNAHTQTDDGVF